MPTPNLAQVVIAFDLDNTLLEFEREDYTRLVTDFLTYGGRELAPGICQAYETIRSWGNAMERLGLANASHQRGHAHALAMLECLWGWPAHLRIPAPLTLHREALRSALNEVEQLVRQTRLGFPADRIGVELDLRRKLKGNVQLRDLAECVRATAGDPFLVKWASQYAAIEATYLVRDFRGLFDDLTGRGAPVVVITHGRIETQMAKIQRLGLVDRLVDRVLITESAAHLPGQEEFDEELERRLDECAASEVRPHASLEGLWAVQCVLHDWGRKSPAFFARCLHAVQHDPQRPAAALRGLEMVNAADWTRRPPRFVMIGDRHDLDVEPLRTLLGLKQGLSVLLAQGKHSDTYVAQSIPAELRPDRVFPRWDELEAFLRDELSSEMIGPVAAPPDCFAGMHIDRERLAVGRQSPFEAVRALARLSQLPS